MELTGIVKSIQQDYLSNKFNITFEINEKPTQEIDFIRSCDKLSIEIKKYRNKRSLDANALLWKCIGDIAGCLNTDKWSVYLKMLKRYGKYTYICVKPEVVDAVKSQWRECEEIGEIDINGRKAIQLLCYFGSSTYDTKEFSTLLDGVISEMKEMELPTPLSEELERVMKQYEDTMVSVHR